jgi:hypothetical protein
LYLPLTWDLPRSKVHNLSQLAKRLGGWVGAYSLAGNGVIQESRRSKDPSNMQVTKKEVKIEVIQPFHLPNHFSIKSVKGSFILEFSASSLDS